MSKNEKKSGFVKPLLICLGVATLAVGGVAAWLIISSSKDKNEEQQMVEVSNEEAIDISEKIINNIPETTESLNARTNMFQNGELIAIEEFNGNALEAYSYSKSSNKEEFVFPINNIGYYYFEDSTLDPSRPEISKWYTSVEVSSFEDLKSNDSFMKTLNGLSVGPRIFAEKSYSKILLDNLKEPKAGVTYKTYSSGEGYLKIEASGENNLYGLYIWKNNRLVECYAEGGEVPQPTRITIEYDINAVNRPSKPSDYTYYGAM